MRAILRCPLDARNHILAHLIGKPRPDQGSAGFAHVGAMGSAEGQLIAYGLGRAVDAWVPGT